VVGDNTLSVEELVSFGCEPNRWLSYFVGIVGVVFGHPPGCLQNEPNSRAEDFIDAVREILAGTFNSLLATAPLQYKLNTALWRRHHAAWEVVVGSGEHNSIS